MDLVDGDVSCFLAKQSGNMKQRGCYPPPTLITAPGLLFSSHVQTQPSSPTKSVCFQKDILSCYTPFLLPGILSLPRPQPTSLTLQNSAKAFPPTGTPPDWPLSAGSGASLDLQGPVGCHHASGYHPGPVGLMTHMSGIGT